MPDSIPREFLQWRNGKAWLDWRLIAAESYFTTRRLVREIVRFRSFARGRMLDIGCGGKPYAPVFAGQVEAHVGVDVPTTQHGRTRLDAYAVAGALPFRDAAFDFVLCTEVLEHVPDPACAFREISRVLRGGGHALVTTPFLYRVHEAPYDFYRYTPFAYRHLAASAGLDIVEIRPRGGYPSFVLDVLFKGIALGVGGMSALLRRAGCTGLSLADTRFVRLLFLGMQWPLAALLARETMASERYTLGFVVLLHKKADH